MDNQLANLSIDDEEDIELVLEGSPWAFNRHLLVPHPLKEGENPDQVPLNNWDIWVRVHDIPPGFFTQGMAKKFGDFTATFLFYDSRHLLNGNYVT